MMLFDPCSRSHLVEQGLVIVVLYAQNDPPSNAHTQHKHNNECY